MSFRDMTVAARAEAAASIKRVIYLAEFHFETNASPPVAAPLYVTNHVRNVVWNSNTYIAVGGLGSVSQINETSNPEVTTVSFTLSGVDSSKVAIALGQLYIGRTCRAYVAFLDSSHNLIADPVLVHEGLMDTMPIEFGEKFASITLTSESVFRRWETPRTRRVNNADQQSRYPGDRGLEYVAFLVNKPIVWGRM